MADRHQIRRVFSGLGELFAAEHSEHDDEGAQQVHQLIRRLRKFSKHEEQEHAPVGQTFDGGMFREASYETGDGQHVYYDDGPAGKETLRDAADLYAVLDENHDTGSPNLENDQARGILGRLQSGAGLGEVHIGQLRKLMAKHAAAIAELRRSRDRDGQDLLAVPSAGSDSRISNPTDTEA